VDGKPRIHQLVTANILLESEFSRECGEWSGNDTTASPTE